MVEPTKPEAPETKSSILTALLEDKDPLIKLATLALVIFGGVGNFFATKQASDLNVSELNKAIQEIHDIHGVIDTTIRRQKEIHDMVEQILSPNHTAELNKAAQEIHEIHQKVITQ
jgi:hypothetical protein